MGKALLVLIIFITFLFGKTGEEISTELSLNPASKAQKQWERIFKKKRKMAKYGIDKLTQEDQGKLLDYLKSHAADSDSPTVPGL